MSTSHPPEYEITPWPHTLIRYFDNNHLPAHLAQVSSPFARLARQMDRQLAQGAEKTVALRKLLEAKDAAVRSALDSIPWSPVPGEWVMGKAPVRDDGYPVLVGWFRGYVESAVYAQLDCEDGDIRTVYAVTLEPAHD